jgi:hypothetical protein
MILTKSQIGLAAILCFSVGLTRADEKISSRDVPEIIRKAFASAYPTAKVIKWEKESKDGRPVFEAETSDGKVNRNVMYSPDGTLVQIEETMAVADLPAAVTSTVQKEYPKAVIASAEKVTQGDSVEYKLSLKNAGRKRLVIRADGSVSK